MNDLDMARRGVGCAPLIRWSAAVGVVLAALSPILSPAISGNLKLNDAVAGRAGDVIEATEPPSGWQSFRFRDYSAQVPAGWQMTEATDDAITFFAGDVENGVGAVFGLALVPEDDILPPHATINGERAVTLAGQPFVWRDLSFDDGGPGPNSEIILLASPGPLEGDRYLLIYGGVFGVPMADHRAEFDRILGSLQVGQSAPMPDKTQADDTRPRLSDKGAGATGPDVAAGSAPEPQPALTGNAIDVEGVTFRLPAGWVAQNDSPGDKLFSSPDGRWTLLSFWWFPDEPLLGYDDITAVENMIIDHEPVTRIHVAMGDRLSIQNVTERARSDGKRFIFTIEGEGASAAEVQAMHDRLVATLHLQGGFDPALRVGPAAAPQPGSAPTPAPSPEEDMSAADPFGLEILDVPAAPPQVTWATYVNPRFGVQIDYPADMFTPMPPPENGDGQAFVARDGASRFSVWGSNNVLAATVRTEMDDFANALLPGAIKSSRETGANRFEIVALRDGKLVFRSEIVDPDVLFGFEAELDDPDDAALADAFATMMASLRRAK